MKPLHLAAAVLTVTIWRAALLARPLGLMRQSPPH